MPAQVAEGYPNIFQEHFKQQKDLWPLYRQPSGHSDPGPAVGPGPAEVVAQGNRRRSRGSEGKVQRMGQGSES